MPRFPHDEPLARAARSLEGLSVGDHYFVDSLSATIAPDLIAARMLPSPPWYYTDDTEMALSLFSTLHHCGTIDQDHLAASFARYYDASRGYGEAMHGLLRKIGEGQPWKSAAKDLFSGQGSFPLHGSMREKYCLAGHFRSNWLQARCAVCSLTVTPCHNIGMFPTFKCCGFTEIQFLFDFIFMARIEELHRNNPIAMFDVLALIDFAHVAITNATKKLITTSNQFWRSIHNLLFPLSHLILKYQEYFCLTIDYSSKYPYIQIFTDQGNVALVTIYMDV